MLVESGCEGRERERGGERRDLRWRVIVFEEEGGCVVEVVEVVEEGSVEDGDGEEEEEEGGGCIEGEEA